MVDMTPDAIRQITKEMKQYQSPELNEKLYLHFKGWKKIEECLGAYTGVRALWLEGNGLRSLDNMGNLKELRCLYIHQNCLETLEGLEDNVQLDAINASNNAIKTISHVSHLKRLNTLQVAHNRLTDLADVEHLAECKTIGVLDISNNKLEDPAVVDVLAKMDNLHVLQMQGNPVTRKIQHYRKTVVARCQKLTYLDDRPVFEDERRTVTAWARGGAGHKIEPNADGSPGELSAVALYEALSDGTFDKNKAHEAEKEERKNIREEKEERERRNREAFREMMLDARVRRVMQILPNTRLLKDVSEAAIEELAHRVCQNPVHTNEVVGLAKDETALHAGTPLSGLYIITRGRLQMQKSGKPVNSTGGGKLASGQYFGEVALCTAHDQVSVRGSGLRVAACEVGGGRLASARRAAPAAAPCLDTRPCCDLADCNCRHGVRRVLGDLLPDQGGADGGGRPVRGHLGRAAGQPRAGAPLPVARVQAVAGL